MPALNARVDGAVQRSVLDVFYVVVLGETSVPDVDETAAGCGVVVSAPLPVVRPLDLDCVRKLDDDRFCLLVVLVCRERSVVVLPKAI